MADEKIKVVIADDHNMVRKGLIVLLEEFDDIEIIAEAVDGEHAVNVCRDHCPDVVLMDVIMPRVNGVEATKQLRDKCPNTKVIALTSFDDDDHVQDALKAGAISYMLKNVSGSELADAIRRANEGQATLSPEAAQVLVLATTRPPTIGHDLTDREHDVLELMIKGLNNREIGEKLVISSSTVKNHVSSILSKMGTSSRTEAVALAVEHNVTS